MSPQPIRHSMHVREKLGLGEQRDAQAAVQQLPRRPVRPFARARGDEAVVLLGQGSRARKIHHVEDGGFEQGTPLRRSSSSAKNWRLVRMSPSARLPLLSPSMAPPIRGEHRHGALQRRPREEVRLVERKNADERVQIDAEQRVVHVEDNRLELAMGDSPSMRWPYLSIAPKNRDAQPQTCRFPPHRSELHLKLGDSPQSEVRWSPLTEVRLGGPTFSSAAPAQSPQIRPSLI